MKISVKMGDTKKTTGELHNQILSDSSPTNNNNNREDDEDSSNKKESNRRRKRRRRKYDSNPQQFTFWQKARLGVSMFIEDPRTESFIICCVFAYLIIVFTQIVLDDPNYVEEYGSPQDALVVLNILDTTILSIFLIEIYLKIIGSGIKEYLSGNVFLLTFDTLIVHFSLIMMVIEMNENDEDPNGFMDRWSRLRGILRLVRVLIVFRKAQKASEIVSQKTSSIQEFKSPVERVLSILTKCSEIRSLHRVFKLDISVSMEIIESGNLYNPTLGNDEGMEGFDLKNEASAWIARGVEGQHHEEKTRAETNNISERSDKSTGIDLGPVTRDSSSSGLMDDDSPNNNPDSPRLQRESSNPQAGEDDNIETLDLNANEEPNLPGCVPDFDPKRVTVAAADERQPERSASEEGNGKATHAMLLKKSGTTTFDKVTGSKDKDKEDDGQLISSKTGRRISSATAGVKGGIAKVRQTVAMKGPHLSVYGDQVVETRTKKQKRANIINDQRRRIKEEDNATFRKQDSRSNLVGDGTSKENFDSILDQHLTYKAINSNLEDGFFNLYDWEFDVWKFWYHFENLYPLKQLWMAVVANPSPNWNDAEDDEEIILDFLNINHTKMSAYAEEVQRQYFALSYHNAMHSCDVFQSVTSLIIGQGQASFFFCFSRLEMFALMFAALIHDINHPGVNNVYMTKTKHPLALRYNDNSVLEQHHCAFAYRLCMIKPELDIWSDCDKADYRCIRAIVISSVLATDLSKHFLDLGRFKAKSANKEFLLPREDGTTNKDDRMVLMDLIVHACDISSPTKEKAVYLQWTRAVLTEFFSQGDREKEVGLPVSMFMDRDVTNIAKCQMGFMDVLVAPLFNALSDKIPRLEIMAEYNLRDNKEYWVDKVEDMEKEMLEKTQRIPGLEGYDEQAPGCMFETIEVNLETLHARCRIEDEEVFSVYPLPDYVPLRSKDVPKDVPD